MIAQLESMMGGPDTTGNPDEAADYELICRVIVQELGPIIQMIMKRIEAIEIRASDAADTSKRIEDVLNEASDMSIKKQFSDILGKYQPDYAPLDDFYSNTYGKKYSDDLMDRIMQDPYSIDDRDGFVQNDITSAKGKYGRYIGAPTVIAPTDNEAADDGEGLTPTDGTQEVTVKEFKKGQKPSVDDMAGFLGLKAKGLGK